MEKKEVEEKIILSLDSYDDIFSDFDPRDDSVRALSVDFLDELKRASMDKKNKADIKLLVPSKTRDKKEEEVIKARLKNHSERHHNLLRKEKRSFITKGLGFFLSGIIVMILATYVLLTMDEKTAVSSFLLIFLEPAGWFLFWEGLDLIIFFPHERKENLDFYRKLVNSKIEFGTY